MILGAALVLLVMLWLIRKQAAIGPSDCRLHGLPHHGAVAWAPTLQFRTASPMIVPAVAKFSTTAFRADPGDFRIAQASTAKIEPAAAPFNNSARLVLNEPLFPLSSGFVSTPPRDDATSSRLAPATAATDTHHHFFDRRRCPAWHSVDCPSSVITTTQTATRLAQLQNPALRAAAPPASAHTSTLLPQRRMLPLLLRASDEVHKPHRLEGERS